MLLELDSHTYNEDRAEEVFQIDWNAITESFQNVIQQNYKVIQTSSKFAHGL